MFLYDYLKKSKEEDILKFNDFSLRNFEKVKKLKILFEQLFEVKNIPHEILYKYWLKAFSSDTDFSSYINQELQTNNFENNLIFVQILYEGLKLNKPTLEINNNTNLYKYSSLEKVKIDNMNIILSKEKSNMPFILIYTKSFLTFYFNENDALKNSYKPNNNVLFVPTTTRTIQQYNRITLPIEKQKFALVCNGGILLEEGNINQVWYKKSLEIIKDSNAEIKKAISILEKDESVNFEIRYIEDLFVQ